MNCPNLSWVHTDTSSYLCNPNSCIMQYFSPSLSFTSLSYKYHPFLPFSTRYSSKQRKLWSLEAGSAVGNTPCEPWGSSLASHPTCVLPGLCLGASTHSWLCGTPLCDYFSHRASSCFHLFMPLSGLRGWHGAQGNAWRSPHCTRSESSRNCSSPPPTQLPSAIYPQDPFFLLHFLWWTFTHPREATSFSWWHSSNFLPPQGTCWLPCWLSGKESACLMQETWVQSLDGEDPQRTKWQPTPVFLPGKSHGQRSLMGYSPCHCKESDMT